MLQVAAIYFFILFFQAYSAKSREIGRRDTASWRTPDPCAGKEVSVSPALPVLSVADTVTDFLTKYGKIKFRKKIPNFLYYNCRLL
jgi:hypothetical protein